MVNARKQEGEVELNLGTLLFFLSIHSIAPYISGYAVSLGAREHEVALLGPALSAIAIALRPVTGFLMGRGLLHLLLISGIVSAIGAQILYWASSSVAYLYIGRSLQGLGVALFIPTSIYTATLAGRNAASSLAWRSTMIGFSMSLGPALGGAVISLYGYKSLFVITSLFLTISAVLNVLAVGKIRYSREGERGHLGDLITRSFIVASSSILFYSILYNGLLLFLPAYHKALGVDVTTTSTMFTAMSLSNFASRVILSALSARIRYTVTAVIGYGLALIGIGLVVANPTSQLLVLYSIVAGVGGGILIPSLQIIALLGVRDRGRALASGIYTAMFDIGNIVGPPLTIGIAGTYPEALRTSIVLGSLGAVATASLLIPRSGYDIKTANNRDY